MANKLLDVQALYKFLSNLSKREKLILYGAVFFISLTIIDRLILSPIFYKMKSLDKEIQEQESSIKNNLHILAQKDRISTESDKYASFITNSKTAEEETTSVLKEVEIMANQASVYLIDLKPIEPKTLGFYKQYSVNLNCEGQMEQIINFMYSIENAKTLLIIDRYQITPKSKESSVARCSMTVSKIVIP